MGLVQNTPPRFPPFFPVFPPFFPRFPPFFLRFSLFSPVFPRFSPFSPVFPCCWEPNADWVWEPWTPERVQGVGGITLGLGCTPKQLSDIH